MDANKALGILETWEKYLLSMITPAKAVLQSAVEAKKSMNNLTKAKADLEDQVGMVMESLEKLQGEHDAKLKGLDELLTAKKEDVANALADLDKQLKEQVEALAIAKLADSEFKKRAAVAAEAQKEKLADLQKQVEQAQETLANTKQQIANLKKGLPD